MFLCYTHRVESDGWSSELTYKAWKTFFNRTFGQCFEFRCQEMQLPCQVLKLVLECVQMCDELL